MAQWIPDDCPTRLLNLTWLLIGIYQSKSIHFSAIVRKWPLPANGVSLTRRLSRFLANPAVKVGEWYEPIARRWLSLYAGGEIRLIMDGSKVGFGHQLLMVALAYRHRAIPLAWCWVKGSRGHSSAVVQLALLNYLRGLMPPKTLVLLVGDTEFGGVAVLRQLNDWRWKYVLRQKGNTLVSAKGQPSWQPFGELVKRPKQAAWWPQAFLTQQWAYGTALLAAWAPNESQPWLLATNLPDPGQARRAYQRRMWIEEMFGDLKGHGFDLEVTHRVISCAYPG